ncbi:MAG: signal peptidase I, archaeal type [Candidatus Nanosalina sp. J07AB43]|nr:MAG: signal peptidase I, archaeal type [Candidatus Nanosalina sp. J07AB43]
MGKYRKAKKYVEESRFVDETYFLLLSVVLAYGLLQTLGTGLGTEKPVVTVISTSMCPALQVGDILVVKGEEFNSIQQGDVVVYNVPDQVRFEVNGKEYYLRENKTNQTPSVSTPLGTVELLDVQPSRDRSNDLIQLEIDGEKLEGGGSSDRLIEGESYKIGENSLSVEYATSLPFDGVPIVHRVVEKRENSLETLGDNNPQQIEFEEDIKPGQIEGTTFLRIPRIGLVKILAMDFLGFSGDQPFVFDNTPTCQSG